MYSGNSWRLYISSARLHATRIAYRCLRCALSGLLAGGLQPSQLVAVTRNPTGAAAQALLQQGIEVGYTGM